MLCSDMRKVQDMWSIKYTKYGYIVIGIFMLTLLYFCLLVGNHAYLGWVFRNKKNMEEILKAHYRWYGGVTLGLWIGYVLVLISYVWLGFRTYQVCKEIDPIFPRQVFHFTICLIVFFLIFLTMITIPCSRDAKELARNFHADYLEIHNNTLNKSAGSIFVLEDVESLPSLGGKATRIDAFSRCRIEDTGEGLLALKNFFENYHFGEKYHEKYLENGKKFEVYYTSCYKIIVELK